jgi:hypothetical protein
LNKLIAVTILQYFCFANFYVPGGGGRGAPTVRFAPVVPWANTGPGFHRSELRREAYEELFRVINSATEFEAERTGPLPSETPSFMRWLVCGKVMFNILMNWEELKAYFTSAELAQ